MIGVDTNVLVRLLTGDDPDQAQRAAEFFEKNDLFLPKTVLLETEWVLRYAYGLRPATIIESLRRLLGLRNVTVEQPMVVAEALALHAGGMDFADALHLTSSRRASGFATFDRDFAKSSRKQGAGEVLVL